MESRPCYFPLAYTGYIPRKRTHHTLLAVQWAALDPAQSEEIPLDKDLAKIKRRAKLSDVYVISEGDRVRKVIVPVSGKGLWSTLYGFLALDTKDLNTIRGLVFYEHLETPGLGLSLIHISEPTRPY